MQLVLLLPATWFLLTPHTSESERARTRERASRAEPVFDFFFYVSRYSRARASSRFSFASFQLCLSDKISFFLMLLPLFLTLFCSSCLLALRQPRPSRRRRLLASARATTAASVPCAYSYSCVDVVVDVAGAGDFETAAHSLTCNLIFKFILFPPSALPPVARCRTRTRRLLSVFV